MKSKKSWALIIGFLAGLLNGLLGAGGGIVLVRGAGKILPEECDGRDVFANALSVMLPISAVSAIAYVMRGSVHGIEFSRFILPAILGGAGGGLLLAVIDTRLLRLIFSALVVWSGITMIF